jgi:parvulin-like peptidyl-prolyl isomerase
MRSSLLLAGLLVAPLLLPTGCSPKIKEYQPGVVYQPTDIAARVNGQKLSWDQVEKRARNYLKDEVEARTLYIPPGGEEKAMDFFRRKAITLFVNKTVLMGEAKRRGLTVSSADRQKFVREMEGLLKERNMASSLDDFFQKSPLGEKETRREFEDGLLIDKLIQQGVRDTIKIEEKDRDDLATELIAKRKESRKIADDLRAQLVKGADFTKLSQEAARGTDKRVSSGDLGEITRGKLGDKQIEDALFSQKVNEIGPVLDTSRGYLLLHVSARTPAKGSTPESVRASFLSIRTPPLLKGKEEIDRVVKERKFSTTMSDLLQALRQKAKIETIYKDLVF